MLLQSGSAATNAPLLSVALAIALACRTTMQICNACVVLLQGASDALKPYGDTQQHCAMVIFVGHSIEG
jgi:hypothetical protein